MHYAYSARKECVLLYCLSCKSTQMQGIKKMPTVKLPRRHGGGGGDATPTPVVFLKYIFCLPVECHHFFIAFPISFYVPPENFETLTPLTFDL